MGKINSNNYGLLKSIIFTLVFLLVMDYYFISIAVVQGISMHPTLCPSDRLIFTKLSCIGKKAKRGDIVIFSPPKEVKEPDVLYVKRIIAIEGDTYSIDDGDLYINDIKIKESYICDETYLCKKYNYTEGIVPKGDAFVIGDNRNNSHDSRRFCCIQREQIKGKVLMRIWPLNRIKVFKNPYS